MSLRGVGCLFALATAFGASADGISIGLRVDDMRPVSIPYQRAIVAWHPGEETMIVESQMNGPAGDYAWVIPVPRLPTAFLASDTTGFDEFARRMELREDYTYGGGNAIWVIAGLVMLGAGVIGLVRPARWKLWPLLLGTPAAWYAAVLLSIPVFTMLGAGSGAATAASMSKSVSAVTVVTATDVGNYWTKIVKSDKPGPMLDWLHEHRANLPPGAGEAISQYVKEGWCFVLAHLKHNQYGSWTPQPLAVRFATAQPVYPMRLTGCQGSSLVLDLYVIASGSATCPPLATWVSDLVNPADLIDKGDLRTRPFQALAWPGCATTRLRGEVTPAQMKNDYAIGIGPFLPVQAQVVRRDVWTKTFVVNIFFALGLSIFVGGLGACLFNADRRRSVLVAGALALVLCGGVGAKSASEARFVESDLVMLSG